jgi:hypothetical protein
MFSLATSRSWQPGSEKLVEVYFNAAHFREFRKATKRQINHAKSADKCLGEAIANLEAAGTDMRDGLTRLVVGSSLGDAKGEAEENRFGAIVRGIRLNVVRLKLALESVIDAEVTKPTKSGERAKRLRVLVEALVNWWLLGGGRSIAPYVRANRRDLAPSVVHGRSGKFLTLAIAVLCGVDVFKRSEVESAVTNVYEARLKKPKRPSSNGVQ